MFIIVPLCSRGQWCVLDNVHMLTRFSMVLCLQDASLQATAEAWQHTVHAAYHSAVKPLFSHIHTPHSSSSIATTDPTSNSCSLKEWLWAVAVVESRAFGAARADVAAAAEGGRHSSQPWTAASLAPSTAGFTGLVPVLDLANHTNRPPYEHRLNPSTATFSLFVDCSRIQEGCSAAVQMSGNSISSSLDSRSQEVQQQQQQQVLIIYGSKDNRCNWPGKLTLWCFNVCLFWDQLLMQLHIPDAVLGAVQRCLGRQMMCVHH